MATNQPIPPVNHQEVAEEIMRTIPMFVMKDDNTFYVYTDGVYKSEWAEATLNREIRSLSVLMNINKGISRPKPATRQFVAEVLDYIRVHRGQAREDIGSNDHILNLKNGLLKVDTMEFTEHTPLHFSVIQYPIEYDPAAKCPSIEEFIKADVNPGDVDALLEYSGYCLIPGNSLKKFAVLYGGRDSGKTTYCKIMENMVGSYNVAHVSPHSIQDNRFSMSLLYGKVLNTDSDIGDKPLSGTASIKQLVGNDEIVADQKHKAGIKFVNKSHIIWGANQVPDIKNDDWDFYDKMVMVNFPHTFTEDSMDRDLISKLSDPVEMSGFLNVLIDARKRAISRGYIIRSETGMTARTRYRMQSNPVASFVEEHVVASADSIPKYVLFDHYKNWCNINGIRPLSMNIFGKKLGKNGLGFEDTQLRVGDTRPTVWLNAAYVDRKPTVQTSLDVKGVKCCQGSNSRTLDMDTGEGECEKDQTSRVSRVNSLNNIIKEQTHSVYTIIGKCPKTLATLDGSPDSGKIGISVKGSVSTLDTLDTTKDVKTLRYDLINFVKVSYPGLNVEDLPGLADAFCHKWPGYRADPGPEYVCQLAEILKIRGWK